jgi:hypothetical protein
VRAKAYFCFFADVCVCAVAPLNYTFPVPLADIIRDEAVMKLNAIGKWHTRTIVLCKDKLVITAIKLPAHLEGSVYRLASPDHHPKKEDLMYLVLSGGEIACFASESAYLHRQGPMNIIKVNHCHVRAAGEYTAHTIQNNSPFHGLGWTIEEADGEIHFFTCENKAQRNSWVTIVTNHKQSMLEGEKAEIVDTIPMHEIQKVFAVDASFLDFENDTSVEEQTEKKMRLGFTREAIRNFVLKKHEHAFCVETLVDGYNSGKHFCFKVPSNTSGNTWLTLLNDAAKTARRSYMCIYV